MCGCVVVWMGRRVSCDEGGVGSGWVGLVLLGVAWLGLARRGWVWFVVVGGGVSILFRLVNFVAVKMG